MALIYGGGYRRIEGLTTVMWLARPASLSWRLMLAFHRLSDSCERYRQRPVDASTRGWYRSRLRCVWDHGRGCHELFYYPYWCLEKGTRGSSACLTVRKRGSAALEAGSRHALDAWISMVVFTLSTVASIHGRRRLDPQGLDPKGAELVQTLFEHVRRPVRSVGARVV